MLSENMKAVFTEMIKAGADEGALFGILSMLGDVEDEEEREAAEMCTYFMSWAAGVAPSPARHRCRY